MTELYMSEDDEVVQLSSVPHISSETVVTSCGVSTASSSGARIQASAAAIELGRKLLLGARAGDTQVVLDLMAKGAPFTTDWLGTCPLHLAASNNHVETCAVLLRAGAGRDARTKVERAPLHLAAANGHAAVAHLLLAYGASVDCRDMLHMTPLHWASERGHAPVVALLLRHGAAPTARSKFRKTPAALAAARGHSDICDMLRAALAAPPDNATDQNVEQSAEKENEPEYVTIEEMEEDPIRLATEEQPNDIEMQHDESGAGARLLRAHGITLLTALDSRPPLLAALDCGRTLVLSDAGKLMLKESEVAMQQNKPSSPLKTNINQKDVILTPTNHKSVATSAVNQKGVVLTAVPVKTPPKPGVKIFTINNKLLTIPKENASITTNKKLGNAQDMQLKLMQMSDSKLLSPSKPPMKAKTKLAPPSPARGAKPVVKIIMNKNNYNKLIATANKATASTVDTDVSSSEESTVVVPDSFVRSSSPRFLRSQLLAAHAKLHLLTQQLQRYKQRLALYEHVT